MSTCSAGIPPQMNKIQMIQSRRAGFLASLSRGEVALGATRESPTSPRRACRGRRSWCSSRLSCLTGDAGDRLDVCRPSCCDVLIACLQTLLLRPHSTTHTQSTARAACLLSRVYVHPGHRAIRCTPTLDPLPCSHHVCASMFVCDPLGACMSGRYPAGRYAHGCF